jgi:hypothetical protein
MPDQSHELIEPFDTDDGSLDDLHCGECFALGVEWERFRQRLKTGKPFTDLCLANNAARLCAMAERQQRFVEHRPSGTAGWAEITVGGQRD